MPDLVASLGLFFLAQFFVPLYRKVEFIPLPCAPRTPVAPANTDRR